MRVDVAIVNIQYINIFIVHEVGLVTISLHINDMIQLFCLMHLT